MKLRIQGNSIRLRLSKPEVESLTNKGLLQEKTSFGKRNFFYALQVIQEGNELSADFAEDTITLFIPRSLAQRWATTELVGFETSVALSSTETLTLLIEKDFKCLDEITRDQSDMYDNPNKVC